MFDEYRFSFSWYLGKKPNEFWTDCYIRQWGGYTKEAWPKPEYATGTLELMPACGT